MNIQVYAGGTLAYDNLLPVEKGYTLQSILIKEQKNTGGTATLLLPPNHPLRDGFSAFKTLVEIYRDGALRWRGRALPENRDFYCRGKITCEGELCFFQDSTLRPGVCSGTPAAVFSRIINAHNARVEDWKRFKVGNVTVTTDKEVEITLKSGKKTYSAILELVNTYGGIILFDSAPDGSRRINWYVEMPYSCNQRISLGTNLTDYSSSVDMTGFATRIIPYGAEDADGNPITINIDGKDYVESSDGIAQRGIIEMAVSYPAITDPAELRAAAQRDADKAATLPETVKLSALDISRQNMGLDAFRIGQRVNAESAPHKLSGFYDLVAMEEELINPGAGSITLTKDAAYYSGANSTLTGSVSSQDEELQDKPGAALVQSMIVTLTATILGAKGGAVRLLDTDGDGLQDTLYIGDNADPNKAEKVWRFNYEGWATSKAGYNGPFIMGATIEDGLLAASVTAANLVAGYIQSKDGKTFFLDLDNGILRANFTELSITGKTVDDIAREKANSAVNAQTQSDIFNKLTNNGALQGLYIQDGNLYINAEYIQVLDKLFAKDITMTGKFTCTAETYLPPTYDDVIYTLRAAVFPDKYPLPEEYDFDLDGSGIFDKDDAIMAKKVYMGDMAMADCPGAQKTSATICIDMSNPQKLIHIYGYNMWGTYVETFISADVNNSSFASKDYLRRMINQDPQNSNLYRTVDDETEYVNPPMEADVEYRTYDRHLGNPVYKKLDSATGRLLWKTANTDWSTYANLIGVGDGNNSVTTYGAKGDGSTDDTAAFQTALAENRVVIVPGGEYVLSDTLVIGANCCLELSQDAVLRFTQTDKNCITLLRLASLKGNHATIFVPYTFGAKVINCDTADDEAVLDQSNLANANATAVQPFTRWDPQWKMSRYVTDINICKPNANGFHYSNDGTCYGTAVYMGCSEGVADYMWGVSMSGLRIAGGFTYGIRLMSEGVTWNHDGRIEAVIDACETAVSVENTHYTRLAVTFQPRPAADGTAYSKHGFKLVDSRGIDLSSSRVWDWATKDSNGNTLNSKWEENNEYQHIALYGNCPGLILDDYLYYAQSTYDIRELIYTDTPSNLEKMTILQEPITRWFKPVDGVPYFSDGVNDKKLTTQEELDAYFDVDTVKNFTDVLATATDTDGTVFNGVGYKNGYMSNAGVFNASSYYVATGFIPVTPGDTLYVRDMNYDTYDGSCPFCLFDADKNFIRVVSALNLTKGTNYHVAYTATENGFKATVNSNVDNASVAFVRLSFQKANVGTNPMIAINEEIKYTVEGFLADGVKVKGDNVVLYSPGGKAFTLSVGDDGMLAVNEMSV